ncbi:zf-HC2 domain-containing protein [Streptomyces sp. ODS28]|uniref:anti-sigma factor family protein n=1 Tax=Streptomyces sp. ODS28 TaxID=3136688 RepID=UPI0031E61A77
MSGTGWGARAPKEAGDPTPAEHHLGDRLAALVDGELGHDARERVLAHLATCQNCKAEADAQRRLKNVFADSPPPAPSDGLLARLQGLPAGPSLPGDDGPGDGARGGPGGGLAPAAAAVGATGSSPWDFEYLPGGSGGRSALSPDGGFRIHGRERDVRASGSAPGATRSGISSPGATASGAASSVTSATPQGAVTPHGPAAPHGSASRGRRFAFAAAGAFSLAALALGGGALGSAGGGLTSAAGDNAAAGPARSANSGTSSDGRRRGGEKKFPAQRSSAGRGPLSTLTASASAAPMAPATSTQPAGVYPLLHSARYNSPFTSPVMRPAPSAAAAPSPSASTSRAPSPSLLSSGSGPGTPAAVTPPGYGASGYGSTLVGAAPERGRASGSPSP